MPCGPRFPLRGVVGAVGAAEGPATAIALPGSLFSVGVGPTLEVLMQSNNGGLCSQKKKGWRCCERDHNHRHGQA